MHGLHELQRFAVNLSWSRPVVMVANPGVGEGELGLAGEKIDQAREVVPVPDVVRRQIGEEGAAAAIGPGVQGTTKALVGVEANDSYPWVGEERCQDGLGVVR